MISVDPSVFVSRLHGRYVSIINNFHTRNIINILAPLVTVKRLEDEILQLQRTHEKVLAQNAELGPKATELELLKTELTELKDRNDALGQLKAENRGY